MSDLRGDLAPVEAEANTLFQKVAKAVSAHPKTTLAVVAGLGILIVLIVLL